MTISYVGMTWCVLTAGMAAVTAGTTAAAVGGGGAATAFKLLW